MAFAKGHKKIRLEAEKSPDVFGFFGTQWQAVLDTNLLKLFTVFLLKSDRKFPFTSSLQPEAFIQYVKVYCSPNVLTAHHHSHSNVITPALLTHQPQTHLKAFCRKECLPTHRVTIQVFRRAWIAKEGFTTDLVPIQSLNANCNGISTGNFVYLLQLLFSEQPEIWSSRFDHKLATNSSLQ